MAAFDADFRVLDRATIQEATNQVTIPSDVVDAGVLRPGHPVFWGYDSGRDAHVLSHDRGLLEYPTYVAPKGPTMLQVSRVLTVPKFYFEDFAGSKPFQQPQPPEERLEYGQDVVFATATAEGPEPQLCFLFAADHPVLE